MVRNPERVTPHPAPRRITVSEATRRWALVSADACAMNVLISSSV